MVDILSLICLCFHCLSHFKASFYTLVSFAYVFVTFQLIANDFHALAKLFVGFVWRAEACLNLSVFSEWFWRFRSLILKN